MSGTEQVLTINKQKDCIIIIITIIKDLYMKVVDNKIRLVGRGQNGEDPIKKFHL